MINGEANSKCCKCKKTFNQVEMVREIDEKATKKWGVKTHVLLCPHCGHDEYHKLN